VIIKRQRGRVGPSMPGGDQGRDGDDPLVQPIARTGRSNNVSPLDSTISRLGQAHRRAAGARLSAPVFRSRRRGEKKRPAHVSQLKTADQKKAGGLISIFNGSSSYAGANSKTAGQKKPKILRVEIQRVEFNMKILAD
jgi:hypothetical protein